MFFTVQLKIDQLITYDHMFIDGTKFEADASNYSFVWKKAIDRYEAALTHSVTTYFSELIQPEIQQAMTFDQADTLQEDLVTIGKLLSEEVETLN
ncbi:hypothetical protein [Facklamia sp. P12934]|uniref:hypothetical protein n=1 Tax=unclassified Facklamia TaxID=2622293 RepID=UPI003D170841